MNLPDVPAGVLTPAVKAAIEARESAILVRVQNGTADPIAWSAITSTIAGHAATFYVMSDALKIDGVRPGMSARGAQLVADNLGAMLLTPKLLDLAYAQRAVTIPPELMYDDNRMMTNAWFVRQSAAVDAAIAAAGYSSGIVQTVGKPWMISNALEAHAGHGENYGWHTPPGTGATYKGAPTYASVTLPGVRVLQQPGWTHDFAFQADYAETCVLLRADCVVDGVARKTGDVLQDATLCALGSHEGPLRIIRQPGVTPLSRGGARSSFVPPNVLPPPSSPPVQATTTRAATVGWWIVGTLAAAAAAGGVVLGVRAVRARELPRETYASE